MIRTQSQPTRLDTYAQCPSHPLSDRKPESEPLPAVSLTVQLLWRDLEEVFSCWVSGYTEVCHGLKSYVWTVSPFTVFLKSFHSCVVEIFGFHLTGEKTGMFYYNSSASVIDFHWLSSETWSFPELYSRKKGERVVWGYEKERNGKQNSKQNKEIQDFICFGIWSTLSRPVVVPI